jgi:hypothetical protein
MADGMAKNIEVVKQEWVDFKADQAWNYKRLKSEPWSRKGHIMVAFVSTTFKELPRTLTYASLTGIVLCLTAMVIS